MRLLLKQKRYGPTLVAMGVRHGKSFDCLVDTCPVCKPYRDKEKEEWERMTEEEKMKIYERGTGNIG